MPTTPLRSTRPRRQRHQANRRRRPRQREGSNPCLLREWAREDERACARECGYERVVKVCPLRCQVRWVVSVGGKWVRACEVLVECEFNDGERFTRFAHDRMRC